MTCQVVGQDLLNSFQDPAIPGIPAVDYPIFSQVPLTSFTCDNQVGNFENLLFYTVKGNGY